MAFLLFDVDPKTQSELGSDIKFRASRTMLTTVEHEARAALAIGPWAGLK